MKENTYLNALLYKFLFPESLIASYICEAILLKSLFLMLGVDHKS